MRQNENQQEPQKEKGREEGQKEELGKSSPHFNTSISA